MIDKNVERQISKIYQEVFKKIFNDKTLDVTAKKSNVGKVANLTFQLKRSDAYRTFAKDFSKRLAEKGLNRQRGLWRKYYDAAKANHVIALPKSYAEFELQIIQEVVRHNFKLIKSIPEKVLALYKQQYAKLLVKEVAEGKLTRGTFLKEMYKHGHKNAKVIARTETAKLQTAILEKRATELGSVMYMWKSSHDRRTRPSHKAMNGVLVFWRQDNEKPLLDKMRGNAGEFPNCRCAPQPVLDQTDIVNAIYPVYDYRNDALISMTRSKVIESLKKGEL